MSCGRRKAPTQSSSCGGCRQVSVLARGPSWPPEPRFRLRRPRPPRGGGVGSPLQIGVWSQWDRLGVSGGEEEGGGVRSGPGAVRTILLCDAEVHEVENDVAAESENSEDSEDQ